MAPFYSRISNTVSLCQCHCSDLEPKLNQCDSGEISGATLIYSCATSALVSSISCKINRLFFCQSKQSIFGKCSVSLESWSWMANDYPTDSIPPLRQVFTAASTVPHPSGQPDKSLPLEAARLPFHELARGWRGGVPIGWKPSAGTMRVTSVARSTSLGARPMACNPESVLKLGLSPSWQCSDLTLWHRFGSTGHRKDIVSAIWSFWMGHS